jgi:hypothetical protein
MVMSSLLLIPGQLDVLDIEQDDLMPLSPFFYAVDYNLYQIFGIYIYIK